MTETQEPPRSADTLDPALLERVLEIVGQSVPGARAQGLSPDTRIVEDLALPSITVVAILFDLQDAFGLDLLGAEVELASLQSVRDLARLVARSPAGELPPPS